MKLCIPVLLLLLCGSTQADMYSCVDSSGIKTLKNIECNKNERSNLLAKSHVQSYTVIESTGETQLYREHGQMVYLYRAGKLAGGSSGGSNSCADRASNTYKPTTIAGALVMRGAEERYQIDCVLTGSARDDLKQFRRDRAASIAQEQNIQAQQQSAAAQQDIANTLHGIKHGLGLGY
jgi:hypothetical protein